MNLTLVTPPAAEPLSWEDAKAQSRIDTDDEQTLVEGYIRAARAHVSERLHRQLCTATYELRLDQFPCGDVIELPIAPVQSVESVQFLDVSGQSQTFTEYHADCYSEPARIISSSWPATQCVPNAITITFCTGYGDPEDVPDGIKLAMLLLVDHWWSNRSAVITGTISKPMEFAVDSLLTPFKWRVK